MEAPPLSTAPPSTPTTTITPPPAPYPDSVASSPRKNDSSHAEPPPAAKLRLMCSYGGHIVPRPHDKTLCYIGGETRIIVIERGASLSDLHRRLSRTLFNNQSFSLKYQLPNEDLDSLITVTSDEDLENMLEEYDRLQNAAVKPGRLRLRLFLFPKSPLSIDQLENATSKPEDWFFNALNGKSNNLSAAASDRGFSESSSINNLLGLDDEFVGKGAEKDAELKIEGSKIGGVANVSNPHGNYVINQDVHSIPDSPMLDTTSSFDSASSSPSMANLPPIRVHVEENRKVAAGLGIEEQFHHMNLGVVRDVNSPMQKQDEEGAFMAAGVAARAVPVVVGGEYRFISDDERSDHGGQRKAQQIQPQQIAQFHQKQTNAFDLPSPDSVSSDGSVANPMYKQRQAFYHQESFGQIQSQNRASSDHVDSNSIDQNNTKTQMPPQFQESGYVVTGQYDQIQPHLHQPQQFIHAGNHYIPPNAVPITPYYSVYPSQPQHPQKPMLDQHYPVYFMSGRQMQAYNLPLQQPSYSELAQNPPSSHPQTSPPTSVAPNGAYIQARNVPSSKQEIASGVYRTAAPQSVQMPSSPHQPQYVASAPMHHLSSAANSNLAYEFADPAQAQMYYSPLPPHLAAQYQTMKSTPAMAAQDGSPMLSAETVQQGNR